MGRIRGGNSSGVRVRVLGIGVFLLVTVLGAGLAAVGVERAHAAEPAESPAAKIEALIADLRSPEQRDALIGQLELLLQAARASEAGPVTEPSLGSEAIQTAGQDKARAPAVSDDAVRAAPGDEASPLAAVAARMERLGRDLQGAVGALTRLPGRIAAGAEDLARPEVRARWLGVAWQLALVLILAVVADAVVRRLLRPAHRRLGDGGGEGPLWRAPYLLLHLLLDLVPLAAFAGAAYASLTVLAPGREARVIVLALVNANLIVRAIAAVGRALLLPASGRLRLVSVSDETAAYCFVWIRRLARVGVYGYFALDVALVLGLTRSLHGLALKLLGLLLASIAGAIVLQNRGAVAQAIRGVAPSARGEAAGKRALANLRTRLADVWHLLAIVYIVVGAAIWVLDIEDGFTFLAEATLITIAALVGARVAIRLAMAGFDRLFRVGQDIREGYPGVEARLNRYLSITRGVMRAVVYLIAALIILQAWGLPGLDWLTSGAGLSLLASLIKIAAMAVVALFAWEMTDTWITRYLTRNGGEGVSTRARTLLPLVRNVVLVVLGIVVTLTVLSEVGVDIAPLLAGAGVVGLAVGFGAQTLVKDVITGAFILFENTVAVGDVATLAGHTGVVEGLTIRTIRLRDLEGVVHTVPFSSVDTIQNMTKDFSYALLDIGVAYREDTDEVTAAMVEVADEMRNDPAFAADILEPMEVLGVDQLGDSAVVVRARLKTLPGKQWGVRRAYFGRIKKRFDERGIEIPFPHLTMYFGEDKQGNAPPLPLRMLDGGGAKPSAEGGDRDDGAR